MSKIKGLTIAEFKKNSELNVNNSQVTYRGFKFIAHNVDYKADVVDLYSTPDADQPCHSSIDIALVEFA